MSRYSRPDLFNDEESAKLFLADLGIPSRTRDKIVRLSKKLGEKRFFKGKGREVFLNFLPLIYGLYTYRTRINLLQLGALKEPGGRPILKGVIAYRGLIHTRHRLTEAYVRSDLSGQIIGKARPVLVCQRGPVKLWAVNVWADSALLATGTQKLWLEARNGKRLVGKMRRFVTIPPRDEPVTELESDLRFSCAYVPAPPLPLPGDAVRTLDEYVLSLPVRAYRTPVDLLADSPKSILVLRTDQLGDVAASVPAMKHLRDSFPEARITVLCQPTVRSVLEASEVADEFITLTYFYDHELEKRLLNVDERAQLEKNLGNRTFDLAIDLSPGVESQPFMNLCRAKRRVSFKPDHFPTVDFGIEIKSRDRINGKPVINHAAHVRMLVNALLEALHVKQAIVPRKRKNIDEKLLNDWDLTPKDYIVILTGARHRLNRWPLEKYVSLAVELDRRTSHRLLFFVDPDDRANPALSALAACNNVVVMPTVTTDALDGLLANARLAICNDTGPKHLAALRGASVLSLAVARLDWREWGQNQTGTILTRQVPCAGCGLNKMSMCTKEAACLRTIPVEDVLKAALSSLVTVD